MKLLDRIKARRQLWRRMMLILLIPFILTHGYGLVLKFMPVPWTMNMSLRASNETPITYNWVPLDDISPYLVYAVIGAEDSRFCSHHGIDWEAVQDVLEEREAGKRRRGGSTITQQVAKNVYLWNGGGWVRKVPETWLALYLDTIWSKRRIMEVYLNIAEWGDGIFGAEAAAQIRFGKSARDLNSQEAALLASVLPSPNKWRLDPPGDYVRKRSKTLITRTADVKWGGYGQCVNVDDNQMRFPASPKPKPPTPEEPSLEETESEADKSDILSVEPIVTGQESTDQKKSQETIDETPPKRL